MLTPFKAGFRISQTFGSRPDYYKTFGFNGHEGADLVAKDDDSSASLEEEDWDLYAVEDGEVVRDVDDPRLYNGYGDLTVVLNRENCRAWWYAHNASNCVSIGQKVKRGDRIARTGLTGNTSGRHCHLGLRYADSSGNPINTQNGFKGFVDPLPVLTLLNNQNGGAMPDTDTMLINKQTFADLVGNSNKWDNTVKYLEFPTDPKSTPFEDVQRVIAGFKSRVTDLQNQLNNALSEVQNRTEQVSRVKETLASEERLRKDVQDELNRALKNITAVPTSYEAQMTLLKGQLDQAGKDKGELNREKVAAEQKAKEWETKYNDLLNSSSAQLSLFDVFVILFKIGIEKSKKIVLKKSDAVL